jgi:hypothetical protein
MPHRLCGSAPVVQESGPWLELSGRPEKVPVGYVHLSALVIVTPAVAASASVTLPRLAAQGSRERRAPRGATAR